MEVGGRVEGLNQGVGLASRVHRVEIDGEGIPLKVDVINVDLPEFVPVQVGPGGKPLRPSCREIALRLSFLFKVGHQEGKPDFEGGHQNVQGPHLGVGGGEAAVEGVGAGGSVTHPALAEGPRYPVLHEFRAIAGAAGPRCN